ncbi:hypothetical protein KEM48_007975 [Puccinia striiformis f. sp. tritici PST-130]|nr:hypothetical protein KEM48_007975 [Puccinia striiformis f. sp. tritici PST-130]
MTNAPEDAPEDARATASWAGSTRPEPILLGAPAAELKEAARSFIQLALCGGFQKLWEPQTCVVPPSSRLYDCHRSA